MALKIKRDGDIMFCVQRYGWNLRIKKEFWVDKCSVYIDKQGINEKRLLGPWGLGINDREAGAREVTWSCGLRLRSRTIIYLSLYSKSWHAP